MLWIPSKIAQYFSLHGTTQLQFIIKYLGPTWGYLILLRVLAFKLSLLFIVQQQLDIKLSTKLYCDWFIVLLYAWIETKYSWAHEINSKNNHQSGDECNAAAGRWKRRTIRMRKHATSTSSPTHGLRHLMMNCTWRVLCSEKYRAIYRRNL